MVKPKLKLTLKMLFVIVGATFALVLIGAVARQYNQNVEAAKQHNQATLNKAYNDGYKQGAEKYQVYKNVYTLQTLACKQGENAYAKLTPAQKRTIPADQVPKCRTEVLQ